MASLAGAVLTNISHFTEISANLPSDIITDIFTRLPIKSLARFKCVSKSMYALLSNPKFVKQHLHRAILNNPNLILKLNSNLFSVDDEDWSKARRLHLPFASSLGDVELSGSCNGLLCVSDQQCNEDIFLYNPFTGVFKGLPFPDFNLPTMDTKCFTTLGFGYHHAEDDYKVVRCVYVYDDEPLVSMDSYQCEVGVFSLNTNKWKKIGYIPFHLYYKAAIWLGNEFLVWKATWVFGRMITFLVVSYDMNKEEFMEIPQPDVSYPREIHMEVSLLGGKLSISHLSRYDRAHIWSMMDYGVKESWTLLYVIRWPDIFDGDYIFLKPLTVFKNGEILIEAGERERGLYDPKNESFRFVNTICGAPRLYLVTTIVGSLVSPFASSTNKGPRNN